MNEIEAIAEYSARVREQFGAAATALGRAMLQFWDAVESARKSLERAPDRQGDAE